MFVCSIWVRNGRRGAARRGAGAEVVSIERDPGVAAVARERLGTRVEVIVGDIAEAKVDGTFDAITGRLILMYVRDPVAVLRDLVARVLRPGGAVAMVSTTSAAR